MIKGFAYFPTIIYRDEKSEWVDNILNYTKNYFDSAAFNDQNNFYQTNDMTNDENLFFLKNYLLKTSTTILNEQGYNTDLYSLRVSELWGQCIEPKSFGTDIHVHPNSQLSGWIFLETSIGGSYPMFYDSRTNKEMLQLSAAPTDKVKNATSIIHFNSVVPGTIILSNSWVKHQLSYNYSDEVNKTLHFVISC